MSIYLNSSSDNSKYLVIYDDCDAVQDSASDENGSVEHEIIQDSHNYNPKRIKLDHIAFLNKLK